MSRRYHNHFGLHTAYSYITMHALFDTQYSVMWNLAPEEDMFKGSTVMFLSISILFVVFIFSVSLVGYAVIGYVQIID